MSKDDIVKNLYRKPQKDKGENARHFPGFKPGYYHQSDLLFLPHDDAYKYALVVVDVGSRIIDARALRSKTPDAITKAFKSIYSGGILEAPTNVISVDG